jgi:hypothetical protein
MKNRSAAEPLDAPERCNAARVSRTVSVQGLCHNLHLIDTDSLLRIDTDGLRQRRNGSGHAITHSLERLQPRDGVADDQ